MAARPVIIIGTIMYTDDGPNNPPGIWGGGNQPFPTPPIANVPGVPGYRPPGHIWDPTFPTPPIANAPGVGPNPNPPNWPPGQGANIPGHPIENPPPITPPDGYEWKQTYSPPSRGGWEWSLVPVE